MDQNPDENNSMQSSSAAPVNGTSSDENAAADNGTLSDTQDNDDESEDEKFLNSFPPGFRFAPTDEELVNEYLAKKIKNEPLPPNRIHEVNLNSKDPPQLTAEHKACTETEWYFFTPRIRKYPNGSRPSRTTPGGYWKPTGIDKAIQPQGSKQPIAHKKTLDFNVGVHPNGKPTDWKMHEYILKDNNIDSQNSVNARAKDDMTLNDWVLCRVYKRRKENNGGDEASTSGTKIQLSPDNEAFLMTRNRNIGAEDQNLNACQHTVNVSKDIEASLMAGNNNKDQTFYASQPVFNEFNNIEALMAGNNSSGFQDHTRNASQPAVNVPHNIETSLMAGNNGLEHPIWNTLLPTINVASNTEAYVMSGNTNFRSWNAYQPIVSQNKEVLMAGKHNVRFQNQKWISSQPTFNALQNNEGSLMCGDSENELEYQNSDACQPPPNQRSMHEQPGTSGTYMTASPPIDQIQEENNFWENKFHSDFDRRRGSPKGM